MARYLIDIPKAWVEAMKEKNYPSIEQYMKTCEKIAEGVEIPKNLSEICKYKGTGCSSCNFQSICKDN